MHQNRVQCGQGMFPNFQNQQSSLSHSLILSFDLNIDELWYDRDMFFVYLSSKHPDFKIIQVQLLPVYLNRTILEIQWIKNRQFYKSKLQSFDNEFNVIFVSNQYVPCFFKNQIDIILCKSLIQNHLIEDIFSQIQLQRQNEMKRFTKNFNQMNFFKVSFISGKILRVNKTKFFQQNYDLQRFVLTELCQNSSMNATRFIYEIKLNHLIKGNQTIQDQTQDKFFSLTLKTIKKNQDSHKYSKALKTIIQNNQGILQPFSSQSWYSFLALEFVDNIQKQIIQFSVLSKNIKMRVRKITQQQQEVIARYSLIFDKKLQKIKNNPQILKFQSVRQLQRILIKGLSTSQKWLEIKKQYYNLEFDWKFNSDKSSQSLRNRKKTFNVKEQQSQILSSNQSQNKQTKQKSSIIAQEKKSNLLYNNHQINSLSQNSQSIQENEFLATKTRRRRRSNRWNEQDQFILFLMNRSGIQNFKNIEKILKKPLNLISKYLSEFIQELKQKFSNKLQHLKNNQKSVQSIRNYHLRSLLQQAINDQKRYQRGKGRQNSFNSPLKDRNVNQRSAKFSLQDSTTTVNSDQSAHGKNQQFFTYQDEVLMYLLHKTYGLRGLLAQKLLKTSQQEIIKYFNYRKIGEQGSQLQVFIKARQAYYEQYPQLLQFESNMHIKLLMQKLLKSNH